MTKLRAAAAALILSLGLAACGPSGDPREPNPLDFEAALPCEANLLADATIAVEVIDRQGRLVATHHDVSIKRDAVSIEGTQGRGGYAIDVPEGRNLPWDSFESAPYCWHIWLKPEVHTAIVSLEAGYPLLPGERLVCFTFDDGGRMPEPRTGLYHEHIGGGAVSMYGRVNCAPYVTKRNN